MCAKRLCELSEMEQAVHVDRCLDQKIQCQMKRFTAVEAPKEVPRKRERTNSDAPKYSEFPSAAIKEELERYGLKKSLDTKTARESLREIWFYIYHGEFPASLNKYLNIEQ